MGCDDYACAASASAISFDDAERLANEALSLQAGRPNVMFTHLVQMALLRWEQGRLDEVRDELQKLWSSFPGPRLPEHGCRSPTPSW